jgi:hypothetical protein
MTNIEQTRSPIQVFISYSHEDQRYLEQLEVHLGTLLRQRSIRIWFDRKIRAGEKWEDEINAALYNSQVILLLVSANYLASSYIWEQELLEVLQRAEKSDVRILPIILRPCMWKETPIAKFQVLPRGGRSISEYRNHDEAWFDVVRTLQRICEEILNQLNTSVSLSLKCISHLVFPVLPSWNLNDSVHSECPLPSQDEAW